MIRLEVLQIVQIGAVQKKNRTTLLVILFMEGSWMNLKLHTLTVNISALKQEVRTVQIFESLELFEILKLLQISR